tara:strand:- start:9471 stop:10010 length:540 start_codon:yes stop_codon:yes gene_type:complete
MAKRTTSRDAFQAAQKPDQAPLRDKDNAAPTLKPDMPHRPAPNLAPPGMSGIRTSQTANIAPREPVAPPQAAISINEPDVSEGSFHTQGRLLTMPGYEFAVKMYDEPFKHGIEGGCISKLDLRKDGELVASYDRGWSKDPDTAEAREAIHRIRKGLDDQTPEREFKTDHDPENDHDISH